MNFSDIPVDPESSGRLAPTGLRLDLVDTDDPNAFEAWLQAKSRGFHGSRVAGVQLDEYARLTAYRRTTGVWDDRGAEPAVPVATVSSWTLPLTVPGRRQVAAVAVSSVTVAPTHHRRGIARALLEAELRTAASQRLPVAVLTASEATLYGRYGFGPATRALDLAIDPRRAGWIGPEASGRVHLVSLQHVHAFGREIMERAQLHSPGDVALDDYLWGVLAGVVGHSEEEAMRIRAVRYDDAEGVPQGFAVYEVTGTDDDFANRVATVNHLCAATDDAYAGLWRYFLELDLIGSVSAPLRSADEPLLWQVANPRAVRVTEHRDHLWLRILDLKDALEARRYSASGTIVLTVSDPLDFAAGRVLLTVDVTGAATVTRLEPDAPDQADTVAELSLGVSELSSLYLGGASATTFLRAGRVAEQRPGSAAAFDALFRSSTTPWLSTWF